MKNLFKKHLTPTELQHRRLAMEYTELTERLQQIRDNFDFVTDHDSIDALIYEENAVLSRLAYLYKQAKLSGTSLEIYEIKKSKIF
ncbi:MAG: DUF2508 family protein [Oscillospiraceae bacterium]|nr:DUF2508 family protein [Oscillospiraceae bacterium]